MAVDVAAASMASPTPAQTVLLCDACKERFASRNALFRHLRHDCAVVRVPLTETTQRVLLVVGYVGHGLRSSGQESVDADGRPTVEAIILGAVRRLRIKGPVDASEADVPLASGGFLFSRTERSASAMHNLLVVSVRARLCLADRSEELSHELRDSPVRLLATPLVLTPVSPAAIETTRPSATTFVVRRERTPTTGANPIDAAGYDRRPWARDAPAGVPDCDALLGPAPASRRAQQSGRGWRRGGRGG